MFLMGYAAIASVEFCNRRMNAARTMYLLSVIWLMLVQFSTESVAAYALDQKSGSAAGVNFLHCMTVPAPVVPNT